MNKISVYFLFVALATLCSARYLPKPEYVKHTAEKWTEVAKKLGWNDEQTTAAVNLMQFIQDHDIASAEMDTNDEWKNSMLNKCSQLAQFDKINELDKAIEGKKWKDVKDSDFITKWEFWNDKYTTWTCEHKKMITLKNMCIIVTEDAKKQQYIELAKKAGLKEAQWQPTADLFWDLRSTNSTGEKKSILADHCEMLNDDGVILEVNGKHAPEGMVWADQADKNITIKMEFWWNVTEQAHCKIAKTKALKNVCVEFMCPVERKVIEDWAKEAGIQDDDIKAAVDMEMRMRLVRPNIQQKDMIMKNYEKLGNNKYMIEPTFTAEELAEAKELVDKDWVKQVHFWTKKYHQTTGADHIKSLKNMCVVVKQEKEKKAENVREDSA